MVVHFSPLSRKVMFEKQWLFLDRAVGQLYSTAFEVVSGGHLEPHKAKTTEGSAGKGEVVQAHVVQMLAVLVSVET